MNDIKERLSLILLFITAVCGILILTCNKVLLNESRPVPDRHIKQRPLSLIHPFNTAASPHPLIFTLKRITNNNLLYYQYTKVILMSSSRHTPFQRRAKIDWRASLRQWKQCRILQVGRRISFGRHARARSLPRGSVRSCQSPRRRGPDASPEQKSK